jgi:lysophospholipase L1-like esterase
VKTVILIGDSIRMGYQSVVRQVLLGRADVWAPEQNGGTSRNVLDHLEEWVLARRPDIVHLNCGLHDLRTEFGSTSPAVPLDEYAVNLEAIFGQIQTRTAATLIWASTTPVNERWHHENKTFDRFEADVLAYNHRALEVALRFGARINDLYELVMDAGRDAYLVQDGVHFSSQGYTLLGTRVAGAIRTLLHTPTLHPL